MFWAFARDVGFGLRCAWTETASANPAVSDAQMATGARIRIVKLGAPHSPLDIDADNRRDVRGLERCFDARAIAHDQQTEGYLIVSGSGTLVTGGKIVNGRKSPPESEVTKVLNGPSCSGTIAGADVVKRKVKTGDIIVIPAGVPHGWIDIVDHVDYLSVRPDPERVLAAGYVNPALQKK